MQNNVYLLSYDPYSVDLSVLTQFLLRHPRITTWRVPALPGSILISTPADLVEIQGLMQSHMQGRIFLITQVNAFTIAGWADHDTWEFIRNPGLSNDSLPKQSPQGIGDFLPKIDRKFD